jgi:predicted metal-dependent phosphoesterase TrpH
MSLHYDLHSHSTASDGTLPPRELVNLARSRGVDVLALTDHDTTAGVEEAASAAAAAGVALVPGVEISTNWNKHEIHVVGLWIDTACGALQNGLAGLRAFREWRAREMDRRLAKQGVHGALEGAAELAVGALVTRTHFARFLLQHGHVRTMQEAFDRYLGRGKPGYVPGRWAQLGDVVSWIRAAGGDAVIAHPARYRMTATRLRELIGAFKACGGAGIEVVSGSHTRDQSLTMANYARVFGLRASRGSDYHGPENPWIELGRLPDLPPGCEPIWQDWSVPVAAIPGAKKVAG